MTEATLARFARDPLFGVSTWNPEPTFWVPTWNPEPPGTHFLGSDLEPGTHRNPLFGFLPGTRNPPEPTLAQFAWNPEPTGTHIFEIRVGSTRNPGTHGFLGSAHADPWFG